MTNLSSPTAGWESWYQEITRDQLIVIICQKQESSKSGGRPKFLRESQKNGLWGMVDPKMICIIQVCKKQLMKMTAQGPEGRKECGSCKDVIDPFGVQGKRSMTSMVKLCYATLFWSNKTAAQGREEGNDEHLNSHECYLVHSWVSPPAHTHPKCFIHSS